VLTAASWAGYSEMTHLVGATASSLRRLDTAFAQDSRVRCTGGLVVRVDDRGSGLARHVVRMLVAAPRPLMLTELHEGWSGTGATATPHPRHGDAGRMERCSALAAVGRSGYEVLCR
jgi:hypothetical protein